jgi:kynurenine formamidase
MDSPRHFYDEGRTISDIGIDELFVPGVVVDVAA